MGNKKINKHRFLIAGIVLALIAIVGSFINFYTMNFFTNTIMEKASPKFILSIFTWIGGFSFAVEFVIVFMFIIRSILHPHVFKKMAKVYSITIMSFSSAGLIATIISGITKYGSLIKPYPFAGAHVIALIFHVINITFCILYLTWLKKYVPNDTEVRKSSALYVLQTVAYSLLYVFIFNRFGALLWAPVYSTWSMFPKLITFYLYLLLPMGILAHALVYVFNGYKSHRMTCLIITGSLLFVSIGLMLSIIMFEMYDTAYIAAISMAMPVERASSKPIDSLLMAIIIPLSLIILFIEQSVTYSKTISLMKIKEVIRQSQKR